MVVREELLSRNMDLFSAADFGRLYSLPSYSLKYFLEKQTDAGLFLRLRKGLYALKTDLPAEEEIANALYRPSYLSFEYALSHYGILPEMTYQITSATTKSTRVFNLNDSQYVYYTLKKDAYQGYSLIKTGEKSFLMADKEKALADYLYFESMGKKPHNDRFNLKKINRKKLLEYARLFERKSLMRLIRKYYANA